MGHGTVLLRSSKLSEMDRTWEGRRKELPLNASPQSYSAVSDVWQLCEKESTGGSSPLYQKGVCFLHLNSQAVGAMNLDSSMSSDMVLMIKRGVGDDTVGKIYNWLMGHAQCSPEGDDPEGALQPCSSEYLGL